MPFCPCVSGCGRYLAPGDVHDRCLSCLGIEHAEVAFVDESCSHCGGMTVAGLRTRLRFLQRGGVPVPLPRSRVPPGGRQGGATSGSSQAGLMVTVRNSPTKRSRALPATGTSLLMGQPREQAGPSHGGGVPLVSFGAPPTIGCRSLHRRVSQTNLEMMVQYRCHPLGSQRCRIRIRKWWLCLPGPLRVLGSSGGLHRVPNIQGWTTGFSGWPALVLRAPPRCLSSRKCMMSSLERGRHLSLPETAPVARPPSPPLMAERRGGIRRSRRWSDRLQCNCVQGPLPPGTVIRCSPPGPVGTRRPWPAVLMWPAEKLLQPYTLWRCLGYVCNPRSLKEGTETSRPVATAPVPPLSARAPAQLLSENLNMRCTCCLLILTLWSAAAGCNNRMPMCIGSFSLHSKWIGLSKRDPNSSILRRDVSVPS